MTQGIKEKDIKAFIKACNNLNSVINRINEYKPTARLYMTSDTMNLLSESSTDILYDNKEDEQFVVADVRINYADCGDW